jgi:glutamate-ammonia-ligase adenylyltransferase
MELELARETQAKRNFKTGRGGVLDVESVVQYLQLSNGATHPSLWVVRRTEEQIAELHALGLIADAHSEVLRAGWEFLGKLSNRLRIVDNRSISELDDERGDLEGLAIRLGYHPGRRPGGARRALVADYRRHTDALRAVYDAVIGARAVE